MYKFMAKVGLTQDKSRNKQPLPLPKQTSVVPEDEVANSRCPQRDSPLWALALALMNIHENISGVMAAGGLFTPAKNQREGAAVSDGGKNVEVGGQNVMEMRV